MGAMLQRLIARPALPERDSDDWKLLITFIALMHARGPALGELWSRPIIHSAKTIMSMISSKQGAV